VPLGTEVDFGLRDIVLHMDSAPPPLRSTWYGLDPFSRLATTDVPKMGGCAPLGGGSWVHI